MDFDALDFEEDIRQLMRGGDLEGALAFLRFITDHIRHDPATTGLVLGSPALDRLCSELGAITLHHLRAQGVIASDTASSAEGAEVIILATELYAIGGHTRVIEDFIRAQPGSKHLILLSNFFGTGNDYAAQHFGNQDIDVRVAPDGSRLDKLLWLQQQLARNAAARVFLFNHHADAAAVAAVQPGLNRELLFFHHADHNLCLGVHLAHGRHVDFFAPYHQRCRDHGIDAEYWPLSVPDQGVRSHDAASFARAGQLLSCSVGSWTKFNAQGAYRYWEQLPAILRATRGRHLHIGDMPDGMLDAIRASIVEQGIAADRLIHVPQVRSVWKTLLEYAVDVCIGSFPLGGGRASLEALGAGIPLITYRHPLDPMLGMTGLGPDNTWSWSTPEELSALLAGITPRDLAARSREARAHYLRFNNPEVFLGCVKGQGGVTNPQRTSQDADDVHAHLLRAISRSEELDDVFRQLKLRVQALPTNPQAHTVEDTRQTPLQAAVAQFDAGQLEAAYTAFTALMESTPGEPLVLVYLGLICVRANMRDDAIVFFDNAIEISQDAANTMAAVGQRCLESGELILAERYLKEAAKTNSQLIGAYALLTDVWHKQGRHTEALRVLSDLTTGEGDPQPDLLLRRVQHARALGSLEAECAANLRGASYPDCIVRALELLPWSDTCTDEALHNLLARLGAVLTKGQALPQGSRRPGASERLRIGFLISGATPEQVFCRLVPLVRELDVERFECLILANNVANNAWVQGLSLIADRWITLNTDDIQAACRKIESAGLDCLLGVDNYRNLMTLQTLLHCEVPLRGIWSDNALPNGLPGIDCLITSPYASSYEFHVRSSVLESDTQNDGPFCFGSVLPVSLISLNTWETWGQILRQTPGARILLNDPHNNHAARKRVQEILATERVAAERILWLQADNVAACCTAWTEIDLGLSPLAGDSQLVTLMALQAGTPCLARHSNNTHTQAVTTLLQTLGLDEHVTSSTADYIAKAVHMAGLGNTSAETRKRIRAACQDAFQFDAAGAANSFAAAIAMAWKQHGGTLEGYL